MTDKLDLGRVPALHQLVVEFVPEHVLFKVSSDLEDPLEQGRRLVRVGRRLSGPDVQSEAARVGSASSVDTFPIKSKKVY